MVDNMILSYLAHAMAVGYDPTNDDKALAEQKVAALRLFLWTDLAVGETAWSRANVLLILRCAISSTLWS